MPDTRVPPEPPRRLLLRVRVAAGVSSGFASVWLILNAIVTVGLFLYQCHAIARWRDAIDCSRGSVAPETFSDLMDLYVEHSGNMPTYLYVFIGLVGGLVLLVSNRPSWLAKSAAILLLALLSTAMFAASVWMGLHD